MVESVRKRFAPTLLIQNGMLILDLALNTAAPLLYRNNTLQLVLYILQDVCTVLNVIILFLSFFATLVFQAGLISLLVRKFQSTIYAALIYLGLSIGYHAWSLGPFVYDVIQQGVRVCRFVVCFLLASNLLSAFFWRDLIILLPFCGMKFTDQWDRTAVYIWTPGLIALYVIQRFAAVFYYYLYKRTSLVLSDPKYYQDSEWLRSKIHLHST